MSDNKANADDAAKKPIRVWLGGAASQCGKAAIAALLEQPNVTVTASARDVKDVSEQFKSAIDAKRLDLVSISVSGGVLRRAVPKGETVPGAEIEFKGYDTFVLIPPPALIGDRSNVSPAYANAAKKGGVKHVVLLASTPTETTHLALGADTPGFVEDFRNIGAPFTVVRVMWFFENLFHSIYELKSTSAFSAPINGDVKLPSLSVNDIGRAGARIVADGPSVHGGKDYTLYAEDVSFNAEAAALGKAVGKDLSFKSISGDAFVARMTSHGVPSNFASGFVGLYDVFETKFAEDEKKNGKPTFDKYRNDLPALLAPHRKPETLSQWLSLPAVQARFAILKESSTAAKEPVKETAAVTAAKEAPAKQPAK